MPGRFDARIPLSTKGRLSDQNAPLVTTFKRWAILPFLCLLLLLFVAYFSEPWIASGVNHVAVLHSLAVNYSWPHGITANVTSESTTRKAKVILIYTTFFGTKEWPEMHPNQKLTWRGKPCFVSNCEWTYDKQRSSESDLVIFHARNMPPLSHLEMLRQKKPPHQRWGYFLLESPQATPNTKPLNGLFHWTITYRRDSDFWSPYGSYTEIFNGDSTSLLTKDFSEGKDKLVAWIVSNCSPRLRKSLVHELQKYIKVDVFGGCSKQFGRHQSCPGNCTETLRHYKFYLGLENALCLDYVTEKYWIHLGDDNLVPIVMNDPKWFSQVAIPGSYINILDFKSVKDVAAYLHYLDKNTTAYNEFFQWRLKYKESSNRFPGRFMAPNPWHCQICEALNSANTSRPQPIEQLTDFWVTKAKCGEVDHKVMNMF